MSGRLLLVASDAALIRNVKAVLQGADSLLQVDHLSDDGGALRARFQPSGIIVDSDGRSGVQSAFERIADARRYYPGVPVLALGNEMSAQLVLAALRAGACDFMDRDAGSDQLRAAIQACLSQAAPAQDHAPGRITGILSAVPSEQDQDFAINLAARAARAAPERTTLLVDLSLPASQAGIALGIAPEFGVGDAIREIARLDRALLESALARDPRSGLFVMPLAPDFRADGMLEAAGFAALLQVLRASFDTVVIAFGPFSRQPALLEMLGQAADLFLCCNQRFPSVQGAADLLRRLADVSCPTPMLVVHELAPGLTPSPAEIRKALNQAASIDLDAEWSDLAQHVNDGVPLAHAGSHYAQGLDACLMRMGLPAAPRNDLVSRVRHWLHPALGAQPA